MPAGLYSESLSNIYTAQITYIFIICAIMYYLIYSYISIYIYIYCLDSNSSEINQCSFIPFTCFTPDVNELCNFRKSTLIQYGDDLLFSSSSKKASAFDSVLLQLASQGLRLTVMSFISEEKWCLI